MAYDSAPGGDPRGPTSTKCARPIVAGEPSTIMHFRDDPYGHRGYGGRPWHARCAQPHWDTVTRALKALDDLRGQL